MKKKKKSKQQLVKLLKKISRNNALIRQREVGIIRSSTWGGKLSPREDRRKSRNDLQKEE